MNCLEAQNNIRAFLDGNLTDKETQRFLDHIEHCDDCREELEIAYTIDLVLQDDDNSPDYSERLQQKITREKRRITHVKEYRILRILLILAAQVILFLIIAGSVEPVRQFLSFDIHFPWYQIQSGTESETIPEEEPEEEPAAEARSSETYRTEAESEAPAKQTEVPYERKTASD